MADHNHTWHYLVRLGRSVIYYDEYGEDGALSKFGYWCQEPCWRCRSWRLLVILVAVVLGLLILLDLGFL